MKKFIQNNYVRILSLISLSINFFYIIFNPKYDIALSIPKYAIIFYSICLLGVGGLLYTLYLYFHTNAIYEFLFKITNKIELYCLIIIFSYDFEIVKNQYWIYYLALFIIIFCEIIIIIKCSKYYFYLQKKIYSLNSNKKIDLFTNYIIASHNKINNLSINLNELLKDYKEKSQEFIYYFEQKEKEYQEFETKLSEIKNELNEDIKNNIMIKWLSDNQKKSLIINLSIAITSLILGFILSQLSEYLKFNVIKLLVQ